GASRRAARGAPRAVPRRLGAHRGGASCRGGVRAPVSPQRSPVEGRVGAGIRRAVTVRRAGPLVCASAVVLASLALFNDEGQATPLTVSLTYAAGPGCPDAADFRAVVIARLGYDPFLEGAPDHVLVEVERRGGALSGRIEWRDASGKWSGDQTFPSA